MKQFMPINCTTSRKSTNSFKKNTTYPKKFLKKLKIELPHYPAILLLGIYLKKTKTLIRKLICSPMFMAALFTIAKI